MMRLILFGAPGSGKGTMGDLIQRDFHYTKISTGDILRAAIDQDSAAGLQARSFMAAGALVPDELVIELVRLRLSNGDLKGGYVMDGYPRTLAQASALSQIPCDGEKAIFIEVTEAEAVQRLLSRMTCRDCGAIFNQMTKPPQSDGICDICRGRVERRADDNEEAVRQRFRVYTELTLPVIGYYDRQKALVRVNGAGAAAAVYERIKGLLA